MTDSTASCWPEQEAVWAWMKKHGIWSSPKAANELAEAVTQIRLKQCADLRDENKTLRALATCACGDGFTADEPGACVNCAMMRGSANL